MDYDNVRLYTHDLGAVTAAAPDSSLPPARNKFDTLAQEITNYRKFLKDNPYNDDDNTGVQQRARVKKILDNVGDNLYLAAKNVTILLNNHRDWINSLDNKDQDKFDKLERELKETSEYFEYQSTAAGLVAGTSIDEHGNPDTDPGQGSLKYINKLADALKIVIGYLQRREDGDGVSRGGGARRKKKRRKKKAPDAAKKKAPDAAKQNAAKKKAKHFGGSGCSSTPEPKPL